MTRTKKARPELPDFKIVFTSPTSSEDAARAQLKQTQMQTLKSVMDNLNQLGITLNNDLYPETRDMIIKEYFGSKLLDTLKNDEKIQPAIKPQDTDNKPSLNSIDSIGGGPSDIISGPDNTPEDTLDLDNEESNEDISNEPDETSDESDNTETSTSINPPSDEDYELG